MVITSTRSPIDGMKRVVGSEASTRYFLKDYHVWLHTHPASWVATFTHLPKLLRKRESWRTNMYVMRCYQENGSRA